PGAVPCLRPVHSSGAGGLGWDIAGRTPPALSIPSRVGWVISASDGETRTVSDRPDRRRCPDEFGNAPRLGDASPGRERLLGVEDLAHGADTGLAQVGVEPAHHQSGLIATLGKGLEPGVDERSEEPRPDRALVVG